MLVSQLVGVASHPTEHRNRHSVFFDVFIAKAGAARAGCVTTVWLPPLPGAFVPLVNRQCTTVCSSAQRPPSVTGDNRKVFLRGWELRRLTVSAKRSRVVITAYCITGSSTGMEGSVGQA